MATIELHPLGRIEAQLGEPVNVGRGPLGSRVVIDVTSAKLTGERINATKRRRAGDDRCAQQDDLDERGANRHQAEEQAGPEKI